jgi:hypothetical protein
VRLKVPKEHTAGGRNENEVKERELKTDLIAEGKNMKTATGRN